MRLGLIVELWKRWGGVEYDFHNGHCGAAFDEVHGAKAILAWLVIVFREKAYLCAYIIT